VVAILHHRQLGTLTRASIVRHPAQRSGNRSRPITGVRGGDAEALRYWLEILLRCGLGMRWASERLARDEPEVVLRADYFPVAASDREPSSDPQRAHLPPGWHSERDGDGFAWTKGATRWWTSARVPAGAAIEIDVAAPDPGQPGYVMPMQNLEVLWNGEPVGSFFLESGRQTLEFRVARERTRHGPNRMDLLPLYWIDRGPGTGDLREGREMGVQVWSACIARAWLAAAVGDSACMTDRSCASDSVVTFAFALPGDARVRACGL
jgi:hypothetical protein